MNSQYMKVNSNELVIDLPVDEAKVTELMESIKAYGLLQSPNIWLKEMRIIDGFHRVVACQRLGLPEIDCIVTECDEEAFWDARIIAAKPHSGISEQRLAKWIIDCWKSSEWFVPFDEQRSRDEFGRFSASGHAGGWSDMDKIAVAQALWTMHENKSIRLWFHDKAKKWGVEPQRILTSLGFLNMFDRKKGSGAHHVLDNIVESTNVSVLEAQAIAPQIAHIKLADVKTEGELAVQWVKDKKDSKTNLNFRDYAKIEESRLVREIVDKSEQKLKLERERHELFFKSPAGKAELHKQALAKLDREIDVIFNSVEFLDISEFPESLRRLTSLISAIENKMEEAFPDHVKKTKVNPFIAENIELRRQLQEQQRKIESLERALNSKQASTKGLPQAAALSSSEIELMAN